MKKYLFITISMLIVSAAISQSVPGNFTIEKALAASSVKNQAMTGTCWCFSTTSLLESQCLNKGIPLPDLSEMFTVRNIYIEKARNYILRQGHAQFGEGGLAHDVIRACDLYGAMPEEVFSGLTEGRKSYDHQQMVSDLQRYLDSVLKIIPLPENWIAGYIHILDENIGVPPGHFKYNGVEYTPFSFSRNYMKFDKDDYINITSFTHQPFYQPFVIQVPDNFSNGLYYNLPLDKMISLVESAVKEGYTVCWDADVSNSGFMQMKGLALLIDKKKDSVFADMPEEGWDAAKRQQLYENLTTQDDHLMHITGIEKSASGKTFFIVKNSWGEIGPCKGYINVSESYFAINTISLVLPKAALPADLLAKLSVK